MLTVSNIEVCYGNIQVLHKVSLHVKKGELVALIGSNGAGKSTVLKAISGLLPKKSGSIYFENAELTCMRPHEIVALGMIMVPEGRRIFPQFTVAENLAMGSYRLDKPNETVWSQCLSRFPLLRERMSQLAATLSGGEQQMLAMARAMLANPSVLMLDEPSMGLAPLLVRQIFDLIQHMREQGMTLLLVEQNAEMALSVADRAYVLENGRIVAEGTGQELRNSSVIQKAYLGL